MKPGVIVALIVAAFVLVSMLFMKDNKQDNHSAERMKKVRAAKARKARERAEMASAEMKIAV